MGDDFKEVSSRSSGRAVHLSEWPLPQTDLAVIHRVLSTNCDEPKRAYVNWIFHQTFGERGGVSPGFQRTSRQYRRAEAAPLATLFISGCAVALIHRRCRQFRHFRRDDGTQDGSHQCLLVLTVVI